MLVKDLAAMIHQNAVDHGWWEDEPPMPVVVALIHSEWSEALEEARAGRPLVYKPCHVCSNGPCYILPDNNAPGSWIDTKCVTRDMARSCQAKDIEWEAAKLEGVAVELIDGCLRILDAIAYSKVEMTEPDTLEPTRIEALTGKHRAVLPDETPEDAPTLIAWLHAFTSMALLEDDETVLRETHLISAMSLALSWVQDQGIDPLALLLEKHKYNEGRPYKHGKEF